MKWKRKIWGLLFFGVICLTGIPVKVHAEEPAIWIQGVNILDDSDYTVECGNGSASYDPGTGVLTLDNATITQACGGSDSNDPTKESYALFGSYEMDLTIHLIGKNTIPKDANLRGIFTRGDITITGDGRENSSFQIHTLDQLSLYCDGNMTIEQATVEMNSPDTSSGGGIQCCTALKISDSVIIVNAGGTGISSSNGYNWPTEANIEDSYVKVTANRGSFNGEAGNLTIVDSQMDLSSLTSGGGDYYNAVYTYGTMKLDSSSVSADSVDSSVLARNLEVTDSSLTTESQNSYGVCVWENLKAEDSVLTAETMAADYFGIYAGVSIDFSGKSQVTAKGASGISWGEQYGAVVTPPSGMTVLVYLGDSEEDASLAQGAPFTESVYLADLGAHRYQYYRCESHSHTYGTNGKCTVCGYEPGAILQNPQNASAWEGSKASFHVLAAGSKVAYQWEVSMDGGNTWAEISGANDASYEVTASREMSGWQYRCIVSDYEKEMVSDAAVLTVNYSTTIYYALHFDTNGGNKMNSEVRESGTVMELSEYVPVREGYTFTGWYADAELTQPVTEVTLDNTKTIYAGWEKIVTDTRKEQKIFMTNPYQERDLANGSRNTMSRVCTLKLGFAVEDPDLALSYETSDPEVASVKDGKITYQGVGECMITVTAAATDLCKEAKLEIPVKVGSLGTPTFTPSVTSRTAKKTFVATSSTVRGVDGWEVQYSIREDFWKPRTKDFPDTGAKLYRVTCPTMWSNRTYYIHVRGYQIIDGEKIYSDWSPVKTIKTK